MPPIGFTAILTLNTVFNLACLCASDEAQGYLHMTAQSVKARVHQASFFMPHLYTFKMGSLTGHRGAHL